MSGEQSIKHLRLIFWEEINHENKTQKKEKSPKGRDFGFVSDAYLFFPFSLFFNIFSPSFLVVSFFIALIDCFFLVL
jgi:hypothetical protein